MHGRILSILFLCLFSFSSWAQASTDCIAHDDLKEIADNFSQFKQFLGNKVEYCAGDISDEWFKIGRSLDVLINIDASEPTIDQDDALTFQAITDKDWWAYFTKRANKFTLQSQCQPGVVAYVMPFFGSGNINLCPFFFEFTVSEQASVMMHEVRHFDGHRHVTCSQGNEKGNGGACDGKISSKGSYAISVQTLVGMARATKIAAQEKPVLEAQAVYMAFNKFNAVPKVKLSNSIVLSNKVGEVYSWTLENDVSKVADLPEPSVVLNSANNLTIFPLNADSSAYRQDNKLTAQIANPGLYAKHYNEERPEERVKYRSISYFATGGLLKGNSLLTLCSNTQGKLSTTNLDSRGQFVTIISLSTDELDNQRESVLLAENGELFRYSCTGSSLRFEKLSQKMKVPQGKMIVDSFGYNGEQYALLDDGTLALVDVRSDDMTLSPLAFPSTNQDWLSATPMSIPEVF